MGLSNLKSQAIFLDTAKKHFQDGIPLDSIEKIINQISGEADYIMVGKPIFNKDLNKLYLQISGPNFGNAYIFTKVEDHIERFNIESWIE